MPCSNSNPRETQRLLLMEVKSGGLAAAVAVRRPLQPRDSNVAASAVVTAAALAGKAPKAVTKVRARLVAAAVDASPPSVKSYVRAESRVVEMKEVSLAEELEKARQRPGWLRAAREVTERVLEERAEALRREASDWERRGDEQKRLVAELMRLLGMPEVYTPVESLRSKEERKRKEAIAYSGSLGSTSTPSRLQGEIGVHSCDNKLEATATTETTATTTESSY